MDDARLRALALSRHQDRVQTLMGEVSRIRVDDLEYLAQRLDGLARRAAELAGEQRVLRDLGVAP